MSKMKKKKIIISQFYHESNSFASGLTYEEDFMLATGDEIDLSGDDSQNTIGAFARKAEEYGWDYAAVVDAGGIPSGVIERGLYEKIKALLVEGIRKNQPVDGVLLSLHGAAVAEGCDDPDGDLLRAVRNEVGPDVPVIVTLDKHANVSELMVQTANTLLAFNNEPHTDPYERGLEAGDLLAKMLKEEINPVAVRVRPPLLLPAINGCTEEEPMKSIMEKAFEYEKKPGVIDVSVLIGFYGSDKADAGPCVVVTTDGERNLAARIASEMADLVWEKRDDFFMDLIPVNDAIDQAKAEGGLYVFIDESDDPFGGASGDNVEILRQMILRDVRSAIFSPIADAEVVAKAVEAGVGGKVKAQLGGKEAPEYGGPVEIEAVVKKIHTDPIRMSEWDEEAMPMGTIVILDREGIDILVSEEKMGVESVNIFREVGLDFTNYNIAVLKGLGNSIKQTYGDAPAGYLEIDSEGCTNPNVAKLGTFHKVGAGIYPFNPNAEFEITVLCNGVIYTMDEEDTVAQALVIIGDSIAYTGNNEGASAYVINRTHVIDLKGKMVVPGFIDGHNHCPGNALIRRQMDLVHCEHSPKAYAQAIKAYAEEHQDDPFLVGTGIRLIDFGDRGPDKSFLDELVGDKPVFLRDASTQYMFMNSKAMEQVGIATDTELPLGVTMFKDDQGEPTGLFLDGTMFMDMDGMLADYEVAPEEPTEECFIEEWKAFEKEALEKGITACVNGLSFDTEVRPIMEKLRKQSGLNLRTSWLCSSFPGFPEIGATVEETIGIMEDAQQYVSDWQSARGVKLYMDGTSYGMTAFMLQPYEQGTCCADNYQGEPCYDEETLKEVVAALDKAGYQVQGHCMGDGSVHMLLDAFAYAISQNGKQDRRHTVIHANMVTTEDIQRMADLGIYAAMQVAWAWNDPFILRLTEHYAGKERAKAQYRVRDMIEMGVTVVASSDYPAGDSTGGWCPLAGIQTGVTRTVTEPALKNDSRYVLGSDQAVSVKDLLKMYTINGARLMFMEDKIGSLETGKRADMVILAEDITKINPKNIAETEIKATIVDGKIRYGKCDS